MNSFPIVIQLFAQAADMAAAATTVPTATVPWWREPWAVWGITLLTVAVPTLLSVYEPGAHGMHAVSPEEP